MSNYNFSVSKSCIYELMATLLKGEEWLEDESSFFILDKEKSSLPFLLYMNQGNLFVGKGMEEGEGDWLLSSFFTLKTLHADGACATLSVLEPIGIDGCRVASFSEVFSLLETNFCLTVDLTCFCAIQFLPSQLIERPLPDIEPKCK